MERSRKRICALDYSRTLPANASSDNSLLDPRKRMESERTSSLTQVVKADDKQTSGRDHTCILHTFWSMISMYHYEYCLIKLRAGFIEVKLTGLAKSIY